MDYTLANGTVVQVHGKTGIAFHRVTCNGAEVGFISGDAISGFSAITQDHTIYKRGFRRLAEAVEFLARNIA